MKTWRIIRTILFVIFTIICLFAGYFDFKYGGLSNKAMYISFIIGLIVCFPSMIKDISSPYKGKKEPKRFVRRRMISNLIFSALLGIGIYFLLGLKPEALAVLEYQMGVEGLWIPFIFFCIFFVIYLIIELLMFYLPRRLGWNGEPESEEEEEKTNKTAAIITGVIILFASTVFIVAELVPGFYDYVSSDIVTLIVALIVTVGFYLFTRKNN